MLASARTEDAAAFASRTREMLREQHDADTTARMHCEELAKAAAAKDRVAQQILRDADIAKRVHREEMAAVDPAAAAARKAALATDIATIGAELRAEEARALEAALCRLFDEYRASFWTKQFANLHTIEPSIALFWKTRTPTFPEQQIYACEMYGIEALNQMDITRAQDKVNIVTRMLEQWCRTARVMLGGFANANGNIEYGIGADHGVQDFINIYVVQGLQYWSNNSTAAVGFKSETVAELYKGHPGPPRVFSAAPIVHAGRVYIEIVDAHFRKTHYDPSICPIYTNVSEKSFTKEKMCRTANLAALP
jgi:hypothetical protein